MAACGEDAQLGNRALSFVERLDALTTQEEVIDAVAVGLAEFGFEHFVITGLPAQHQRFEQVVLLRRWPAGWFEHYAKQRYVEVDPVIRQCRNSVQPFEWEEAPYSIEREPKAHELMTRAVDFGLRRGFSMPVHGVQTDACFSMSGTHLDLTSRTKRAIHLMAMYAYERARQLAERNRPSRELLTPREREVLVWAAIGKSAADIAEILAITERTVTAHTCSAMQKLGAANKTQAVVRALQAKLISL